MKPFSDLTGREKKIELLRWCSVLPAAVLGGFIASIMADVVVRLASPDGMLRVLITEFPKGAAIVITGAKTAPRARVPIAMILAALWISLSVIIHVLLRGRVGWSNYMAVVVAAVAAVGAAAFIRLRQRRS